MNAVGMPVSENPILDPPDEGWQPLRARLDQSRDAQRIADILAGHEEAFADLTRLYLTIFSVGIQRILQNEADTQIALQEALFSIRAELRRLISGTRFSAWAYRICINEALMLRRSRMRRAHDNIVTFIPK
jgi:RNA polymerase sigma-70 factor (ECF subfamily)